jgi:bifunctional non-homologous end joining protein LigD
MIRRADTADPRAGLTKDLRRLVRRAPQPQWIAPMLATLSARSFSDPQWIFEPKLDGVRCLVFKRGDAVQLMSRARKNMNRTWPELVEAIASVTADDVIADGEIVTFDGEVTSFSRLQARMGIQDPARARRVGVPVYLYLFDLLYLNGSDLRELPLLARKNALRAALSLNEPLRYCDHVPERGEELLEQACRRGWEGLIAKRADAPYRPGRSRAWLKLKCIRQQEFVIGGWTDPQRSRRGFGALLLGYYDDGRLRYAGKVGTGFNDRVLWEMSVRLKSMERKSSPFADAVCERGSHWVKPRLVAQVAFGEWTPDGRLRHPRFLGLRTDKPPAEVTIERAAEPRV